MNVRQEGYLLPTWEDLCVMCKLALSFCCEMVSILQGCVNLSAYSCHSERHGFHRGVQYRFIDSMISVGGTGSRSMGGGAACPLLLIARSAVGCQSLFVKLVQIIIVTPTPMDDGSNHHAIITSKGRARTVASGRS